MMPKDMVLPKPNDKVMFVSYEMSQRDFAKLELLVASQLEPHAIPVLMVGLPEALQGLRDNNSLDFNIFRSLLETEPWPVSLKQERLANPGESTGTPFFRHFEKRGKY